MWRRYNPNPQGLIVGDCTVRAICAVTGRDWRDVHRELCDLARDMADMPSSDRVWWELLRMNGFTWRQQTELRRRILQPPWPQPHHREIRFP